jgi:hypothetical protein
MKTFLPYLELAARWHVFIMINTYGWGKILGGQFYRRGSLPDEVGIQTLDTVNSFDLAWTFMGHSYTYILFVGLSQIIGGWCLLFERTKILGIAILLPILVNIIAFDAIFFETYGALASAVNYFFLLLLTLYLNREKIIQAFNTLTTYRPLDQSLKNQRIKTALIVATSIGVIFGLEQVAVNILGH